MWHTVRTRMTDLPAFIVAVTELGSRAAAASLKLDLPRMSSSPRNGLENNQIRSTEKEKTLE